jgi:hypothetical protein
MFRAVFYGSLAAALAGALAAPALCAPTPTVPNSVDLSPVIAAEPALTAKGNPVDLTPIVNGAEQISDAALGASADAQSTASPFGGTAAVGASSLAGTQGGANTNTNINISADIISDQELSAINTGNAISAGSITNGPISIGTNAFSGFNGIGNFLMNTGNQNNIEGTLSVNIVASPSSH